MIESVHFIKADHYVGFYEMFILCFVLSAEGSICRSIKRQYYQIMALEVHEPTVRGKCGAGGSEWFFVNGYWLERNTNNLFKSSHISDIRVFVPAVS
jgi:hypothetical protein